MAGVSISMELVGLDEALSRLGPIFDFEPLPMMEAIGALGESQTRRRITDEKTAPDGSAWAPNIAGTSILFETGRNLVYSLASSASEMEAEWGADWEFAHVHQDGAVIVPKGAEQLSFVIGGERVFAKKVVIPSRRFVGVSAENAREIEDLATDFLGLGGLQ